MTRHTGDPRRCCDLCRSDLQILAGLRGKPRCVECEDHGSFVVEVDPDAGPVWDVCKVCEQWERHRCPSCQGRGCNGCVRGWRWFADCGCARTKSSPGCSADRQAYLTLLGSVAS